MQNAATQLSTQARRTMLRSLLLPPSSHTATGVWAEFIHGFKEEVGGTEEAKDHLSSDSLFVALRRPGDEHMYMTSVWAEEARGLYEGVCGAAVVGAATTPEPPLEQLATLCVEHIVSHARLGKLEAAASDARAQIEQISTSTGVMRKRPPWQRAGAEAAEDREAVAQAARSLRELSDSLAQQAAEESRCVDENTVKGGE